MLHFLGLCFGTLGRLLHSRHSLLLENLDLRQQLVVLKRRHPRSKLKWFDRLFWLPPMLVGLETSTPRRHARNCGPMAPRWISVVLESHFRFPKAYRKKTRPERGSQPDLSNG
jgi:hypothetical protein